MHIVSLSLLKLSRLKVMLDAESLYRVSEHLLSFEIPFHDH